MAMVVCKILCVMINIENDGMDAKGFAIFLHVVDEVLDGWVAGHPQFQDCAEVHLFPIRLPFDSFSHLMGFPNISSSNDKFCCVETSNLDGCFRTDV